MKKRFGLSIATVAVLIGVGACVADQDIPPGGSSDGDAATDGGGDGSTGSSDGATGGDSSPPPTAPPTHAAAAVSFVDVDPAVGTVGGTVLITKAANESDVSAYVIYLTDASGTKPSAPLTSVKATGTNLTYKIPEGTAIPAGITQVLVTTKNAIGEMASGPTGAYADGTLHAVSVTDSTSPIVRAIGAHSTLLFDDTNRKLIVVTGDLSAFACDLTDESCKRNDISAGVTATALGASAIDTTNGKLITLGQETASDLHGFFAPLDLSSAITKDMTNGLSSSSLGNPTIALDAPSKKLFVVTQGAGGTEADNFFTCALDGTSCTANTVLLPSEVGGTHPSLALDDGNAQFFIASNALANSNPYQLVCPLSLGFACVEYAATSSGGGGIESTMLVDTANSKTLIVGVNSSSDAFLYVCASGGGACSTVNLTVGTSHAGGALFARAAIDSVDKKLVVVINTTNSASPANVPTIVRCNLNGTSCTYTDFSTTSAVGHDIDVAVDPESGQIFGFAQSNAGGPPYLFFQQ